MQFQKCFWENKQWQQAQHSHFPLLPLFQVETRLTCGTVSESPVHANTKRGVKTINTLKSVSLGFHTLLMLEIVMEKAHLLEPSEDWPASRACSQGRIKSRLVPLEINQYSVTCDQNKAREIFSWEELAFCNLSSVTVTFFMTLPDNLFIYSIYGDFLWACVSNSHKNRRYIRNLWWNSIRERKFFMFCTIPLCIKLL